MATATEFALTPNTTGIFSRKKPSEESAKKVSELLQENHTKFHIYFNDNGFHNHIPHHLLTLFALSAPPSTLTAGYTFNTTYQRPLKPTHSSPSSPLDLSNRSTFHQHLNDESYYPDYLSHFKAEISTRGYPAVINTYLLSGDARADDMLARLLASFVHPLIHMGYGVEFEQPALVAEGLAEACVHDNWVGGTLGDAEVLARRNREQGQGVEKTLVELALEARGTKVLKEVARPISIPKRRDPVLEMGLPEMVALMAQWRVGQGKEELEGKVAELMGFAAYMTAAAQREGKKIMMDFFCIHFVNVMPMLVAWLEQEWVRPESKRRLLEWLGRLTLGTYVAKGSAELRYEEISGYKPVREDNTWEDVFERAVNFEEDGHASKLIRALAFGEQRCGKWEGESWMPMKKADWGTVANMAIESVDSPDVSMTERTKWIFDTGFNQSWEKVPQRSRL
ncbi:MAG: hypothetical protein MMC23_001548 [Stictis urceolatum]|nr:hypothetical protein [Stictis urceolata]